MHSTMSDDPRAEVTALIGCKGGSLRWRTELLNRESRLVCNIVYSSLICLPFSDKQYPHTQIRAILALVVSVSSPVALSYRSAAPGFGHRLVRSTASLDAHHLEPARVLLQRLALAVSGLRERLTRLYAATWNSVAMNFAWALMSPPPMFRTCPFLIIAIAS